MQEIISLLEEKNRQLERFLKLNEGEIINFSDGNFENLETFYHSREVVLDMIRRLDRMVEEQYRDLALDASITSDEKGSIISALDKKNELVTKILSQDLQILSVIELAKSNIIKELRQLKSARKVLGSYKSGLKENHLDEKA